MKYALAVSFAFVFITPAAAQEKPKAVDARDAARKQYAETVEMRFDVPYAGTENPKQQIDLYLPKKPAGDGPLPLVVFIHGGGWSGGDRKAYVARACELVSTGKYAAAAVGYRLSGEVKWPAQIYDCKAAIRWLRGHAKELNIDPERIGATGSSAGGHLVTLLGVSGGVKELEGDLGEFTSQSSRITCVINFCGPQDMGAPLMQGDKAKEDDPAVSGLFGGPLADHAEAVKAASPLTYVSKNSVPVMTVHGTADSRVDYKHAEWLDAALKKAGVESLLIPMAGGLHGFPTGPELQGRMQQFWDRHLRGVKSDVEIATTPIDVPAAAAK